jgi:hypothetical protein
MSGIIEDACEVNLQTIGQPDALWVKSAELAAAYEWWCEQNRKRFPLGRGHFGERLQAKGFR